MPSIRQSWEHREALLREADEVWTQLAAELEALIPPSMKKYATEVGWIKSETAGHVYWKLPEFLQYLVQNTTMGGCNSDKIRETELEVYGFANFQELEAALNDLSNAWSGLVRISINTGESHRWEVFFYADELNKAPLCMEGPAS